MQSKYTSIGLLLVAALFLTACSSSRHVSRPAVKHYSSSVVVTRTDNRQNQVSIDYINQYGGIAVEQMKRYKIPASITLAQGLLESGAGMSTLTRQSNNHFGIKVTSDWKGKSASAKDNGRYCDFRAYPSAAESYEDHSKFLLRHPRYASLFQLKSTDYKGWAYGLKRAGYAEDPGYPQKLINLIELYQLPRFDRSEVRSKKSGGLSHELYMGNNLYYIRVQEGDSFKNLKKELGLSRRKWIKYNDLPDSYQLRAGDVLYIMEKNRKGPDGYLVHTMSSGESVHAISQRYGIRLDRLYRINRWSGDYAPSVGDIVKLR